MNPRRSIAVASPVSPVLERATARLLARHRHPAVRRTARAWLAAYDAARARGASEAAAAALGDAAWDRARPATTPADGS